jgi:hypothetical protein
LASLKTNQIQHEECLKLFNFIEAGNEPSRKLKLSEYRDSLEMLWNDKLQQIIEEIHVRIPILGLDDNLIINGSQNRSLWNSWKLLSQMALDSEPILVESNTHGDSTLSNLLLIKDDSSIRSIDPNPNQLVRNSSIDHGKVLQSLLLKYEDSLLSQTKVVMTRNEITYTPVINDVIDTCGRHYLDILREKNGSSLVAELMCFSSMLRLLPYRMDHDFPMAPLFLAQTIEYGNRLLVKYEK